MNHSNQINSSEINQSHNNNNNKNSTMETFKRFCSFFTTTRRAIDTQWTLQDLPLEIMVRIIRYLPLYESSLLRNECRIMRLAVGVHLRDQLSSLRAVTRERTNNIKNRMIAIVNDHSMIHPGLLKTLLSWRSLMTDLSLLNIMIWRYRNDMHIWCILANLLVPIIEEVKKEVEELSKDEWKSIQNKSNHPKLVNFLKKFTTDFEVHFFNSELYVPFELRLIELLFCCPCGNLQMVINHTSQGMRRIDMHADLRNLQGTIELPKINEKQTRLENEREILCFMRGYIRKATLSYVREVIKVIERYGKSLDDLVYSANLNEIISFISNGDESSIQYEKRNLKNGGVQEIYQTISTMNVGKCGMFCSFEVANTPRVPMIGGGEISFSDTKLISFNTGACCVACRHPVTNNYFTMGITSEKNKTNFVKEVLIMYEADRNNYTLSAHKHFYR